VVAETAAAKALIAELSDTAAAELARLDSVSAAARAEAEQQSARRMDTAEQDFEITLRSRRNAAERQREQDYQQARVVAVNLVEDAHREVQALAVQRDEIHARLRELHSDLSDVVDGVATVGTVGSTESAARTENVDSTASTDGTESRDAAERGREADGSGS
jgi:glutathione S-transferase